MDLEPTGSIYANGYGAPERRNELASKLKPTALEGVRAARLPNRHLIVTQGTAIPCVLETAMSSDVAGFVSCVVERDVMSDSGQVVLMEKGTQIVGEYRGNVRRGSKRMFVLWTRAKTPTGVIVALSSPATDALGRSGFDGEIDNHFFERFGGALLLVDRRRRRTNRRRSVVASRHSGEFDPEVGTKRRGDRHRTIDQYPADALQEPGRTRLGLRRPRSRFFFRLSPAPRRGPHANSRSRDCEPESQEPQRITKP